MRTFFFCVFFVIAAFSFAQNFAVTNFTTSNSPIASNDIVAIKAAPNNDIWFGTNGSGVSRYNGSTWTTYTTTQGLVGNTIKGIDADDAGNIWIATTAGLSKFNGSTFTNYTTAQGLASNNLRCVFVDNSNNVWAGTAGAGVSKYNGISFTTYDTGDGLLHNFVLAITEDFSGNMFFGVSTGVSKFTGSVWTSYTTLNGSNTDGDQVQAATTDADGNIWVGSLPGMGVGGGLYKFNGSSWTAYSTTNGLASNDVRGIASDVKGRLWISTYINGTSHFRNSTFTTYGTGAGLVSVVQQCAEIDNDGYVWIGTTSGVSRIQTVVYHSYTATSAHCGNNDGTISVSAGTINAPLYYSFNNGASYQSSNVATSLSAGSYQIWLTDSSVFLLQTIIVGSSTTALDAIPLTTYNLCEGDSVQLNPDPSFTNFIWSPDSVVDQPLVQNPYIFPSENMWINVVYTDSNGCLGTDSIQFFIMPKPTIYINVNDSVFTSALIFANYQWYLYGDTIPGATGQTYTATQPGIYVLCANNNGQCIGCSDPINYDNAGIGDLSEKIQLFAENGNLHWNFPENDCAITVYSPDGRVLQYITAADKLGQMALNNRESGILLIRVQGAESEAWIKVFNY